MSTAMLQPGGKDRGDFRIIIVAGIECRSLSAAGDAIAALGGITGLRSSGAAVTRTALTASVNNSRLEGATISP